jgi:hypothetical protein
MGKIQMDISKCEFFIESDLINIIRSATLAGDPRVRPFEGAYITIEKITKSDVTPTKKYVFQNKIDTIHSIYSTFTDCGMDLFKNWGFLTYSIPSSSDKFVYTMPIVEIVNGYPLLTVGHHKVMYAGNRPFMAAIISIVCEPYQSVKIRNMRKWDEVTILNGELPENENIQKDAKSAYYHRKFPFPGILDIPSITCINKELAHSR